jgi:hypothetical protein
MITLEQRDVRRQKLTDALNVAVEKVLGTCYDQALIKHGRARPVPAPKPLTGFPGEQLLQTLIGEPGNEKLRADIKKCDKDNKAALDSLYNKYKQDADALDQAAYDARVRASGMILTDHFWLPRANRVRPIDEKGWHKEGWDGFDRPALVFEVNTVPQLKAFVSKPRATKRLLILLRRRGIEIKVAGEWKTLPELAAMIMVLGGKVRVYNEIYLGADDSTRNPDFESALLGAFHSEKLNLYLFEGSAALSQVKPRTMDIDAIMAELAANIVMIKKIANIQAVGLNDYAKGIATCAGVMALFGFEPLAAVTGIGAAVAEYAGNRYAMLAADPPRGDYQKRAAYQPVTLPNPASTDPLPSLLHSFATAVVNQAVGVGGLTLSTERLQGANETAPNIGDDVRYVQRQARAAADFAAVAQDQIAERKQLLPQLKSEWAKLAKGLTPVTISADFADSVCARFDQSRSDLAKAGAPIPAATATAFKKELRAEIEPKVGTTMSLPASFPAPTGLRAEAQGMKSLEKSFSDLFATIEQS